MSSTISKSKIISSLLWKLLERGGTQGLQFIVSIILARLLTPEIFGTVALVMVFLKLAEVFVQGGLYTALIQKKETDAVDFSSVFYVNLALSSFLYLLICLTAPSIAIYFKNEQLAQVLRVLGITLLFGAVNGIQIAHLSRNMMFKESFKCSTFALCVSGLAGIITAYYGFGIWALVIQHLTNQATVTLVMWFTVKWRPICAFSFIRVKSLFSFGYKLLLSWLLNTLYSELSTLLIGKLFSSSALGFYNKGRSFPSLIASNIDGSIQAVMLPTLSAHQDDRQRVKAITRRAIKTSSFLMFPLMMGMAALAEPMVRLLLTDRWLPAVPFLQVYCFTYMLWPIHTANLQAINALGRSDIFLKLEVIKKAVGLIILVVSVPMGVMAIALGGVVTGIISSFINAWPNKKLLGYSYIDQVKDIIPSLGISVLMGLSIWMLGLLQFPTALLLVVQISAGAAVFILASVVFKIETFHYLCDIAMGLVKKNKAKNDEDA